MFAKPARSSRPQNTHSRLSFLPAWKQTLIFIVAFKPLTHRKLRNFYRLAVNFSFSLQNILIRSRWTFTSLDVYTPIISSLAGLHIYHLHQYIFPVFFPFFFGLSLSGSVENVITAVLRSILHSHVIALYPNMGVLLCTQLSYKP